MRGGGATAGRCFSLALDTWLFCGVYLLAISVLGLLFGFESTEYDVLCHVPAPGVIGFSSSVISVVVADA